MKKNFMFAVVLSFALISLSQTCRAGDCQDRNGSGKITDVPAIEPNYGLNANGQPIVGPNKKVHSTVKTGANT